ncbi:alpha/beta hydrolase [uncultured Tenacibaculum sp.]|uniref:alpha/beta hydrolase n=1 Tax=uncultured Tenacibaculum sp. TaxID=174713 RepID=UPI00261F416E|nr:alpha/beta hydrolase [uncultured Tenacibaculum sp.]
MHSTLKFKHNNTNFFGQYWKPQEYKAIVIILHGLGEHSGRFSHVAEELVKHDYAVIAFDHYGHGKTEGKRGHNPGYEYVMDSITAFTQQTENVLGEFPTYLYGHSMGGNAVLNFMLSRDNTIKGVIATSAFLKLAFEPPKWKIKLGKMLQKIAPSLTLDNEVDASFISRDENEVKRYINDPLVHSRVSPNFSLAFIDKGNYAIENASKLKVPGLLLHGTDDKLISYLGSEQFANNNDIIQLKLYKDAYHELHNDLCKEETINDIITWLNAQQ